MLSEVEKIQTDVQNGRRRTHLVDLRFKTYLIVDILLNLASIQPLALLNRANGQRDISQMLSEGILYVLEKGYYYYATQI
ncbi:hypothetical protein FGO68_gene2612 [Halteria grandinella]|uniref:Uncharacterized protein n=1 Tax=Halteria grandinella TaxID=5974 RepID=A0A8J8SYB6_HALGN|nr:hypothetical protein FGO68_gene2612 [Halteria grandinella]